MIVPSMGQVGKPITFEGYAYAFNLNRIVSIEFSMDGGNTWTCQDVGDSTPERWVHWSFTYTPRQTGHHRLLVRAVDEHGQASPEPESADVYIE